MKPYPGGQELTELEMKIWADAYAQRIHDFAMCHRNGYNEVNRSPAYNGEIAMNCADIVVNTYREACKTRESRPARDGAKLSS